MRLSSGSIWKCERRGDSNASCCTRNRTSQKLLYDRERGSTCLPIRDRHPDDSEIYIQIVRYRYFSFSSFVANAIYARKALNANALAF
mgnify:CR=1 FL=1